MNYLSLKLFVSEGEKSGFYLHELRLREGISILSADRTVVLEKSDGKDTCIFCAKSENAGVVKVHLTIMANDEVNIQEGSVEASETEATASTAEATASEAGATASRVKAGASDIETKAIKIM